MVDTGVMAPTLAFRSIFEEEGVPVTEAEAREPMGMHKRVRRVLQGPAAAAAELQLVSRAEPITGVVRETADNRGLVT